MEACELKDQQEANTSSETCIHEGWCKLSFDVALRLMQCLLQQCAVIDGKINFKWTKELPCGSLL
jgi:hypothetical protein